MKEIEKSFKNWELIRNIKQYSQLIGYSMYNKRVNNKEMKICIDGFLSKSPDFNWSRKIYSKTFYQDLIDYKYYNYDIKLKG